MADEANSLFRVKGTDPNGNPYDQVIPVPKSVSEGDRQGFIHAYLHTAFTGEDQKFAPTPQTSASQDRLKAGGSVVTGEPPGPPGFSETLGHEENAAGEEVAGGLSSMAAPLLRATGIAPNAMGDPGEGAVATAGGILRGIGAFPNAVGAGLGAYAQDKTGSPALATAADVTGQMGAGALQGLGATKAIEGGQAVLPRLPGASAAFLQQQAGKARELTNAWAPPTSSDDLYSVVDKLNPQVTQFPNLKSAASDIIAKESKLKEFGAENSDLLDRAQRLSSSVSPKTVPTTTTNPNILNSAGQPIQQAGPPTTQSPNYGFQDVRDLLRRLGQQIDEYRDPLRRSTGSTEKLAAAKKLYGATLQDLQTSAEQGVGPAADALTQANQAAKREFGLKELSDVIESGINRRQGNEIESINFGTMLKNFKRESQRNELFGQAFTPDELKTIEENFIEGSKLPIPRAPKGAPTGSSIVNARAGVGAMIGAATGIPGGAAIGAGSGIVLTDGMSRLLASKAGGRVLTRLAQSQPGVFFSPHGQMLLSAAGRAIEGQQGQE